MESCPLSSVMMTEFETSRFCVEEQRAEYLKTIVKPNWKEIFARTVLDAIALIDKEKVRPSDEKILKIKVLSSNGKTQVFSRKTGEMLVIGTLEGCDILLPKQPSGFSRGNAFIGIGLDEIVLCDLGSMYGFASVSKKDGFPKHSIKPDGGRLTRRFGIDEKSFVLKINRMSFLFEFEVISLLEEKARFLTEVDSPGSSN